MRKNVLSNSAIDAVLERWSRGVSDALKAEALALSEPDDPYATGNLPADTEQGLYKALRRPAGRVVPVGSVPWV